MAVIILNLGVNEWNVIKFVIMELLLSVGISEAYSRAVSSFAGRLVEQGDRVRVHYSSLNRLGVFQSFITWRGGAKESDGDVQPDTGAEEPQYRRKTVKLPQQPS